MKRVRRLLFPVKLPNRRNFIIQQIVSCSAVKNEEDYIVDIKVKTVTLTEAGVEKTEKAFGIENLYDHANVLINHHIHKPSRRM